jgi:CxxC motif-containing protein
MIPENQRLVRIRTSEDELTCIVCPIGCHLTVETDADGALLVHGNKCKRGVHYAEAEFSDPRRVVTGTCAVAGGQPGRVPVKSSAAVPVGRIPAFLNVMYSLRVLIPVDVGEVIQENVANTGIDLVATMTIDGGITR